MALTVPVPLEQLARTGSTVTIEELSATTPGGSPRQLILVGGALPFKGAEWGGDTRVITTWYPGNGTEATQQNLGPMELPSNWSGMWRRTHMGRLPIHYQDENGVPRRVIEPFELYEILEAIRISGARLRVTWSVTGRRLLGTSVTGKDEPVDRSIVREGRLKSLKINPDTEVDIAWQMTFDWMSRGGRQEKTSDVRRDADLSLASSATQQSISALDALVDSKVVSLLATKRLSASKFTLGHLETLANAPKLAVDRAMAKLRFNVNQFKRLATVARKLATTPYALAGSVVDFARNTTAIANQFVNEFGRTPPELVSLKNKVSDLMRSQNHFGRIANQMAIAAREGAALDQRLRTLKIAAGNRGTISVRESSTTRAGDLVAIHVSKDGDTPIRVSSKYYSSPDHSDAILRANRLPLHTPRFRKGQILIIPALATTPRR